MGLKPDTWIRDMVQTHRMIEPFVDHLVTDRTISYGLSSYGYDIRIGNHFKIFTNVNSAIVDPKAFSDASFIERKADTCIIPPNSYVLASSLEWFRIPRNVFAIIVGKSSYARCGIGINCTPAEPGWHGQLTIEIANQTPLPAVLYANEGIAQILFFEGDGPCEVSYADRLGKYQGQRGITLPRL